MVLFLLISFRYHDNIIIMSSSGQNHRVAKIWYRNSPTSHHSNLPTDSESSRVLRKNQSDWNWGNRMRQKMYRLLKKTKRKSRNLWPDKWAGKFPLLVSVCVKDQNRGASMRAPHHSLPLTNTHTQITKEETLSYFSLTAANISFPRSLSLFVCTLPVMEARYLANQRYLCNRAESPSECPNTSFTHPDSLSSCGPFLPQRKGPKRKQSSVKCLISVLCSAKKNCAVLTKYSWYGFIRILEITKYFCCRF